MTPLRPIARHALAAQSDERLVRLLREGHGPAFEEIVRRYRAPLVAFATAIVSHSRAEDVVQVSLEKAHSALLADDRDVILRPWLFTIVRNAALNLIRSEPATDELVAEAVTVPGPGEAAERAEELDRLVVAICALPAPQREALVKRELEGIGHGEIAAQLGTTATAVRGLIFRARTALRNAVGALVPLPILRALLAQGPAAAGVAGGGAGAGAGAALLGGAGAKGVTAVAAAIVAVGAGIAIDRGHRGADTQRAEAATSSDHHRAGRAIHTRVASRGGTSARSGAKAGSGTASSHPTGAATDPGGGRHEDPGPGADPSAPQGGGGDQGGGESGSPGGSSGSGSGGSDGGSEPSDPSGPPVTEPPPPPPSHSGSEGENESDPPGQEGSESEPSTGPTSLDDSQDAPEIDLPEPPEDDNGSSGPD